MAQITQAHHTGLQVESLDRSIAFYRDVLGFEETFRWNPRAPYIGELVGYPDVDLHAAILKMPGSSTFLELLEYRNVERAPVDTSTANPGTAHIAFFVDDLDTLYEELRSKGIASCPNRSPRPSGRTKADGLST
jgi:catechol 2,3-dioxygenase-like lactoylglutathione lyase family enzyme